MTSSPRPPVPLLSPGAHVSADDGTCLMEAVSGAANLPWSDAPACTPSLLGLLARLVNDASSDSGRQRLTSLIPELAGTGVDGAHDDLVSARVAQACAAAALDRRFTPLRNHLHRVAAAQAAREERTAAPGLVRRVRRRVFERGPGARAVEVAVTGLLRLPTPERDRALRELLEAGLATRPARPPAACRPRLVRVGDRSLTGGSVLRPWVILEPMRFTEHELTAALTGAAKTVLAAQRKDVRRGKQSIDDVWDEMTRYQRFQLLDSLGTQVLPVMVALPDVDVQPGTRPAFTDQQVSAAVEGLVGDDLGRLRRQVVVKARVALVRAALASVPPRSDPDALIVPDHL